MTTTHLASGTLRSLLRSAKQTPHDDAPRLVLADWLEDHGDADRAEFVRTQLLLAPGSPPLEAGQRRQLERRCRQLIDRRGGCWLAGLWRWYPPAATWHRGLLTVELPRRFDPDAVGDVAAWADTLLFRLTGRDSLRRAAGLLALCEVNHVGFDLRHVLRERTILDELEGVGQSPDLKTVSIDWPLKLLAPSEGGPRPSVSKSFLTELLSLPVARHLTHLGSSWPFDPDQSEAIRDMGVEPAHARHSSWMHDVSPGSFRPRGPRASGQ